MHVYLVSIKRDERYQRDSQTHKSKINLQHLAKNERRQTDKQ